MKIAEDYAQSWKLILMYVCWIKRLTVDPVQTSSQNSEIWPVTVGLHQWPFAFDMYGGVKAFQFHVSLLAQTGKEDFQSLNTVVCN